MRTLKFLKSGCRYLPILLLLLGSSSCRRNDRSTDGGDRPAKRASTSVHANDLSALPGALYQSQASSPIRWQPWTKETIEKAKSSERLMFCVIALPQVWSCQKVLSSLAANPEVVSIINENYVPVLIDGDASREMGLLVPDLCVQIDKPVHMPFFMWMTHECNPMAWIPVQASEDVATVFSNSNELVKQMWRDSMDYVLKNSEIDNDQRRKKFNERKLAKVSSQDPENDAIRSIRQFASLYDPLSRSLDETGGLFPASSLEVFATVAVWPAIPDDLRTKCAEVTKGLVGDLLASAMIDPLDGGVCISKKRNSWDLPNFSFDCSSQARAAAALFDSYRATGDQRALDRGLEAISFAEKEFSTEDGLFAIGLAPPVDHEKWMWTVEEVESLLGAEDAKWWIEATGMKKLGNIPLEEDANGLYFRKNTIGMKSSVEEIAARLSLSPEQFRPRYEAAKAKLRAAREARIGEYPRDKSAHAGATFRMVSAYAMAFSATGKDVYRDKAVALLKRGREAFAVGPKLRMFNVDAPESVGGGRAFLYAVCLQAVLDVAAVTLDESLYIWSDDLATTLAELFIGDGFLKECPDSALLIDLPITSLAMIFDDSTCGLISMSESRLAKLGRPLVSKLSELATPFPLYAVERPVTHADLILATISRHFMVSVLVGEGVNAEMLRAVQELSPRMIHRQMAKASQNVPSGMVKIVFGDGTDKLVASADALKQGVLPELGQ
ncbi:MAG: hypothetical protein RLY69_276 [Verrucomicrobiota bacterium]